MSIMEQTEINNMLQEAKKYDAEKYLAEAAKLLKRNKKIDIEIVDCEWFVVANRLILKIIYSVNGHAVILRIIDNLLDL